MIVLKCLEAIPPQFATHTERAALINQVRHAVQRGQNKVQAFLETLSDLDLVVTSWLRTPAQNLAVGGHPESQHLIGWAIDLVGRVGEDSEQLTMAAARAEEAGLISVMEDDHLHVQVAVAGDAADLIRLAT